MKKFVLSILSVLCILSFISCGSKDKPTDEDGSEIVAPVVTEADNAATLAALENARKTAIESGAETKAPEQLEAIDALYAAIKEKADQKVDVSKEGQQVSELYLALSAYINAKETKAKVEKTEKFNLAQKVYDEGCVALSDTEALYDNPEATSAQLLERATKAETCFNSVWLVIQRQAARDERAAALETQKNCNLVKAQVSMKDKYNQAVDLFRKGDSLYSAQKPSDAYDSYKAANEMFDAIYKEVSEKRAAALKAIEDAKKAVEDSSNYAETADSENPILAPVEGIESEDAVLLEEDTYENPEDSEVELSEDVDDPLQKKVEEVGSAIEDSVKSTWSEK